MISERRFVEVFSAFWQELLPMGERYIRWQNLALDRYTTPLMTSGNPHKRGLINETASRLFAKWIKHGLANEIPDTLVEESRKEAVNFVRRFRDSSLKLQERFSDEDEEEVLNLVRQMQEFPFFRNHQGNLVAFPRFDGCGIIDSCNGDLLTKGTLIEVKAGDRPFRLVDVRQVLVYCALNHAKPMHKIEEILLINPRRGVYFSNSLDSLCLELSGISKYDIFQRIIDFASQPVAST